MNLKGYFMSATAAALMATSIFSTTATPVKAAEANTTVTQPEATKAITTPVPYNVYKDDTLTALSGTERNMTLVGNLAKKEDGKFEATVMIKNQKLWAEFKTEVDGKMVDTKTVSVDQEADTRVAKFDVDDLKKPIKVDLAIQAGPAIMKHTVYLKFNTEAVAEQAFQVWNDEKTAISQGVTRSVETPAHFMTVDGKTYALITLKSAGYWQGFKSMVNGELVEATVLSEDPEANTRLVKIEVPNKNELIETASHIKAGQYDSTYKTYFDFNKVLEGNQYTAVGEQAFQVWNDEKNKISNMANFITTPAKIVEKDGKKYAEVTIKQASIWQSFKTTVEGKSVDVETVSENQAADTKVVRFELPKEKALITANIHIKMAGYEGKYVTYLDFDKIVDSTKPPVVVPPVVKPVDPNKVISTTKYNYALKAKNKKSTSAASGYIVKPLTVQKTKAGKYFTTVKLKNATMWKSFKTEVNGKMVTPKTVATDKKKNTKTVKFQVKSPKAVTKTTFTLNTKNKKLAGKHTNYFNPTSKYVKAPTVVSTKKYNYKVLKTNKKSTSATDGYMVKPASVVKMSDGKYYATVTIKNASWWKSFKTDVNGKLADVKTVSTNKAKNTRVVKFQIASPKKLVKSTVHIKATSPKYEGKYTNYIQFGKEVSTKKIAKVSSKAKTSKKSFTVYKNKSSKKSMMDQYVKKPATISKVGSKTYVKMTLKNSSWWKSFQVKQGSKYVNAKVVSKTKNTRTVMFPVSSLKKASYAKVHVVIPSMKYNHKYTTKIVFK